MAKKIVVGHIVYNIGGESRELDVALTNSKKKTADFTKFIKSVAGIGGAAIAFRSLIRLGKDLVAQYSAQEQAEAGLAAAIRATGGDVDRLMFKYKNFASSIQEVTTIGDEQALQLLQQAQSFGITEDRMEEATRGAIGLSKAFGVDMNTALRGVALAYEGNFAQLSRYIPALRGTGTEAEKLAILQKSMADGFAIARAQAETGAGALLQYKDVVGDLKEEGGRIILDFMAPYVRQLTDMLAKTLQNLQAKRLLTMALRGEATSVEEVDRAIKNERESLRQSLTVQGPLTRQVEATQAAFDKEAAAVRAGKSALESKLPILGETLARQRGALGTAEKEIQLRQDNIRALEVERKRIEELGTVRSAEVVIAAYTQEQIKAQRQTGLEVMLSQVDRERAELVNLNNFRLAEIDMRLAAEKAAADERVRIEQDAQAKIQQAQSEAMDFLVNIWGQLDSLNQARLSADLAAVESNKQAELASFKGTEEEKQALIAEFEKEKARLEYESALKSWKLQVAGALAALARSILEAAKNAWPIPALPMMALAGIMGGIQLAALRAAKPVPSFAEGADFVVPPGFDNDTFPMNVESGERVTVTPAGAAPAPMMERPLVLTVDGTPIYRGLLRATQNGIALVAGRAVI